MKVRIEKIRDNQEEESALIRVVKVNETINRAVELLKNPQNTVIVQNINSGANEKVFLDEVMYVEYLERNIFLYTKSESYCLRTSLTKFMETYANIFIQIKKNLALNCYFVQSFATNRSGSLVVILATGEKLVVSRRYVKKLKESLSKLADTGYE